MVYKNIFFILTLFCMSCKTAQTSKGINLVDPAPGTCNITAQIVEILPTSLVEANSVCAQHPCLARVLISDIAGCGSGVTAPMNAGDTVTMNFTYTLSNTKHIFPTMEVKYPGLRKGEHFIANVAQRMAMGKSGTFTIQHYEKIKIRRIIQR